MQRTWTNRWGIILKYVLPFVVMAGLIAIDQVTKYHFKALYESSGNTVIINNFFELTYTINTGAAWSFLSGVSWAQTFFKVLTVLSLLLFGLFLVYAFKKEYTFLKFALVLVIAGTIGNFIDRILIDGVIDFLSFTFWGWAFPVFNIADSCLTIGVIMIIIHYCFLDKDALFRRKSVSLKDVEESDDETVEKDD